MASAVDHSLLRPSKQIFVYCSVAEDQASVNRLLDEFKNFLLAKLKHYKCIYSNSLCFFFFFCQCCHLCYEKKWYFGSMLIQKTSIQNLSKQVLFI